ncbi:hypothetical protein INT43_003689 [Umbelopsis isabellina]|uniref:Arrestin C-terminal-like domain-containing protein n=1 Tax=Mortierella isabellina TaxID=91625 RepID=A0A8H7UHC8_MORIS|nr:hypothetical protein INT43_003689 [Umbelopsis isabellina]
MMKVSPTKLAGGQTKSIDSPMSPTGSSLRQDRSYLRRSHIAQPHRRNHNHFFSASLFKQDKDSQSEYHKDDESIAYTGSIVDNEEVSDKLDTVTKHNKLDAQVYFRSPYSVAGASVEGFVDLNCLVDGQVRIGRICVELIGYEEVNDRAKVNTEEAAYNYEFLHQFQKLQDPTDPFPVCDLMTRSTAENDFWSMEKGRAALPFSMALPKDVGSSFNDKSGCIRYVVVANIEFICNAKVRTLCVQKALTVHQNLATFPPDLESLRQTSIVERAAGKVFMGGPGFLSCEARLSKAVWTAGCPLTVSLRIRNATSKKVSNVRLALIRRIKTFCLDQGPSLSAYESGDASAKSLSPISLVRQTIAETSLSRASWWNGVLRDSESEFMTDITIPVDEHTIRDRTIVQVSHVLQVSLSTSLTSEISVELPMIIVNPLSIEPPQQLFEEAALAVRGPLGASIVSRAPGSLACDVSSKSSKLDSAELSATASSSATSPMVESPRSMDMKLPKGSKAKGVMDSNGEPMYADLGWAAANVMAKTKTANAAR